MRFSIRMGLYTSFGVILLLLAIIAVIGWQTSQQFAKDSENVYSDRVQPLSAMTNVLDGLAQLRVSMIQYYQTQDTQQRATLVAQDPQIVYHWPQ